MANSFKYNKTTTTSLQVCGIYDAENMTIDDGEGNIRNVKTLLSDFEGAVISLKAVVKDEETMDEPQSEE